MTSIVKLCFLYQLSHLMFIIPNLGYAYFNNFNGKQHSSNNENHLVQMFKRMTKMKLCAHNHCLLSAASFSTLLGNSIRFVLADRNIHRNCAFPLNHLFCQSFWEHNLGSRQKMNVCTYLVEFISHICFLCNYKWKWIWTKFESLIKWYH